MNKYFHFPDTLFAPRILTDYNQLSDVRDAGDGKNVGGLNTGVRLGEGLEGGYPLQPSSPLSNVQKN